MSSTLTITETGGTYYLSGMIDETTDLSVLKQASEPLKLNMRSVLSINSSGLRTLLQFLHRWAPKEFAYYECSAPIIQTANVLPSFLGDPPKAQRIISLSLPYYCEYCQADEEYVVLTSEIVQLDDEEVEVPPKDCPKCQSPMIYTGDADTYFLWLTDS